MKVGLSQLRTWQPRLDTLIAVSLLAGGLWLFRTASRDWATAMFTSETRVSLSPIKYDSVMHAWAALADRDSMQAEWSVLVARSSLPGISDKCPDRGSVPALSGAPDMVLLVEHGAASDTSASAACALKLREGRIHRRVDWTSRPTPLVGRGPLLSGFVLLDSNYRVLYGSSRVEDLPRAVSLVAWLKSTE